MFRPFEQRADTGWFRLVQQAVLLWWREFLQIGSHRLANQIRCTPVAQTGFPFVSVVNTFFHMQGNRFHMYKHVSHGPDCQFNVCPRVTPRGRGGRGGCGFRWGWGR